MKVSEINKLTSIDINKLSDKELREIANTYFSAMNKRLKRIEQADETGSPSYRNLAEKHKGGARFSSKGKSREELKSELAVAKHFSQSKVSTVSQIKKLKKEYFNKELGIDVPKNDKEFWKAYRKFEERNPNIIGSKHFDSKTAQKYIANEYESNYTDFDDEDIIDKSTKKVKNIKYDW